jgi:predicted lipid carrier protein YhbT
LAKFLSDEWLDAVRAHAGASAAAGAGDLTVRLHVAVGDVQFHAIVDHGTLEALASGPLSDADVSLTVPFDDAVALQRGETEASVLFMQGRMKTAGDPGKLLDLLARSARPGFAELRDAVGATTDF